MNKQEFAKIVQAWAEGETIQWRPVDTYGWSDIHDCYPMNWNLTRLDYRIKPKEITTMRFAYVRPDSFESSNMQHDSDNLKLVFTNNVLTYAEVLK